MQRHLRVRAGADQGSVSGEYFGRAPGFRNTKPERGNFLARIAMATSGTALDVTPYLTEAPRQGRGRVPSAVAGRPAMESMSLDKNSDFAWLGYTRPEPLAATWRQR
ncbi:MAG: hypothetical protein ACYCXT_03935 [Acidiferrobacteraceae bacterium]